VFSYTVIGVGVPPVHPPVIQQTFSGTSASFQTNIA